MTFSLDLLAPKLQIMARILILDDSIDILEVMELILNRDGHTAVTAYKIDIFMQELKDNKPDLIFIDVHCRFQTMLTHHSDLC